MLAACTNSSSGLGKSLAIVVLAAWVFCAWAQAGAASAVAIMKVWVIDFIKMLLYNSVRRELAAMGSVCAGLRVIGRTVLPSRAVDHLDVTQQNPFFIYGKRSYG